MDDESISDEEIIYKAEGSTNSYILMKSTPTSKSMHMRRLTIQVLTSLSELLNLSFKRAFHPKWPKIDKETHLVSTSNVSSSSRLERLFHTVYGFVESFLVSGTMCDLTCEDSPHPFEKHLWWKYFWNGIVWVLFIWVFPLKFKLITFEIEKKMMKGMYKLNYWSFALASCLATTWQAEQSCDTFTSCLITQAGTQKMKNLSHHHLWSE